MPDAKFDVDLECVPNPEGSGLFCRKVPRVVKAGVDAVGSNEGPLKGFYCVFIWARCFRAKVQVGDRGSAHEFVKNQ